MARISFSVLWVLIFGGNVIPQSIEAGYGHYGGMIYWKGKLPVGGPVEIVRSSGNPNESNKSWPIHMARDIEVFLKNAQNIPPVFKDLFSFDAESATYYLDQASDAVSVEDIPMSYSPGVLFAFGLGIWDTTVVQGNTYTYQIHVNDQVVGDPVSINTDLPTDYDWKPLFFDASRNEPVIRSRWYISDENKDEVSTFLGYRAAPTDEEYRIIPGPRTFSVRGDSILAIFTDTTRLPRPGIYHYAIRPVDRFGRLGPWSEYAQGANFPPESEPLMTYFKATGLQEKPEIRLEWRIRNAWRIRSMTLYRSRHPRGPFQLLRHISPKDSVYIDQVDDVMEAYYYYFEMDDIARPDSITTVVANGLSDYRWPATRPDSITVEVDSARVFIRWKRGGNRDRGYYVMRTKGFGEPDRLVSSFIRAETGRDIYEWIDTTSALDPGSHYSWAVISESIGYVKSNLSEIVSACPDIPLFVPAPTELQISRINDTAFLLTWSNLSTREKDHHLGYRVYQKVDADSSGLINLTREMILYQENELVLDHITPADTFYVKAYNIVGDVSELSSPKALIDPFFYKFGPEYLMGKNLENGFQVTWNKPLRKNIRGYTLYRMGPGDEMNEIARITDPGNTQWIDRKGVGGETYHYFITAYDSSGLESEASKVLTWTKH